MQTRTIKARQEPQFATSKSLTAQRLRTNAHPARHPARPVMLLGPRMHARNSTPPRSFLWYYDALPGVSPWSSS